MIFELSKVIKLAVSSEFKVLLTVGVYVDLSL